MGPSILDRSRTGFHAVSARTRTRARLINTWTCLRLGRGGITLKRGTLAKNVGENVGGVFRSHHSPIVFSYLDERYRFHPPATGFSPGIPTDLTLQSPGIPGAFRRGWSPSPSAKRPKPVVRRPMPPASPRVEDPIEFREVSRELPILISGLCA